MTAQELIDKWGAGGPAYALSERAGELAKRTLAKLYNEMPAWHKTAHEQLDQAIATAYGWTDHTAAMSDSEVRARLLALNLSRPAG